jgi:hypothetical protein
MNARREAENFVWPRLSYRHDQSAHRPLKNFCFFLIPQKLLSHLKQRRVLDTDMKEHV